MSLSNDCEDLLLHLLKYEPNERICFDDFFNHKFLNISATNEEIFVLIKELITEAANLQKQNNWKEALLKYNTAINYLKMCADSELDSGRKESLNKKVCEYNNYKKEIEKLIDNSISNATSEESNKISTKNRQEALFKIFKGTPQIIAGLEIGFIAELYLADHRNDIILDKITAALDVLIPLLSTEPVGPRKEILHDQIEEWLTLAETLKYEKK